MIYNYNKRRGENEKNQLGLGNGIGSLVDTPEFVAALRKKTEPRRVYCGATVGIGITRENQVFSWGAGSSLGLGARKDSSRPFLIAGLRTMKVIHMSLSDAHVLAVTSEGDVYSWGCGPKGQLGLGSHQTETSEPCKIESLGPGANKAVARTDCSAHHSLICLQNGDCYTMGLGSHGRLGLGHEESEFSPTRVPNLSSIGRIATADDFSLALSHDSTTCFVWGWRPEAPKVDSAPVSLSKFDSRPILDIVASRDIAFFLVGESSCEEQSMSSSVYSMGCNGRLLGHGDSLARGEPTLVDALENQQVVQVSCSSTHAAALCKNGSLFTWGEDTKGALGSGFQLSINYPHITSHIAGFNYSWVFCGRNFTAAIVKIAPGHDESADGPYGTVIRPPPPPQEFVYGQLDTDDLEDEYAQLLSGVAQFMTEKGLDISGSGQ